MESPSASTLRRVLGVEKSAPRSQIIASGAVPKLVQMLSDDREPDLQREAAAELNHLCIGDDESARAVYAEGAAAPLVALLRRTPDALTREHAASALGNLIWEDAERRDAMVGLDLVPALADCLAAPEQPVKVLRRALASMLRVIECRPVPDLALVLPLLPRFVALMQNADNQVAGDAAWCLYFAAASSTPERVAAVVDVGAWTAALAMLQSTGIKTLLPATFLVDRLARARHELAVELLGDSVLPRVCQLLRHPERGIRMSVCSAVLGIAPRAGAEQFDVVVKSNLLVTLLDCCSDPLPDVQQNAVFFLTYLCLRGERRHIGYLIGIGGVHRLCDLLTGPSTDFLRDKSIDTLQPLLIRLRPENGGAVPLAWVPPDGTPEIRSSGDTDGAAVTPPVNVVAKIMEERGAVEVLVRLRDTVPPTEISETATDLINEYFPKYATPATADAPATE